MMEGSGCYPAANSIAAGGAWAVVVRRKPCRIAPSVFTSLPHLTAAHANPLSIIEGLAHINLTVGGRDHLHLGDAAVDNLGGEREFVNHADGDGTTAGLQDKDRGV